MRLMPDRGSADRWGVHAPWYAAARMVCLPLARWFLHLRWEGADLIPREGPALMVSNHLSNIDPFMLAAGCPRDMHFMAKREVFRNPCVRFLITRLGAVPIDRDRADVEAARVALRLLREGQMLVIFPEGTRSRSGQLGPFRTGVANIALKLRAPIVPAAVTGTDGVLPPGASWPRSVPVFVRYGPAFELTEYYDRARGPAVLLAATEEIRRRVAALLPPHALQEAGAPATVGTQRDRATGEEAVEWNSGNNRG